LAQSIFTSNAHANPSGGEVVFEERRNRVILPASLLVGIVTLELEEKIVTFVTLFCCIYKSLFLAFFSVRDRHKKVNHKNPHYTFENTIKDIFFFLNKILIVSVA
jgi:hypothetical protein